MRRRAAWLVVIAGCTFSVPSHAPPGDGTVPDTPTDGRDVRPDTDPCTGPDGDGDGVADACDPCPADSPDDPDGDGVCSSVDACPGGDDHADADGDAVADACDDWPCGPKPASPPASVTWEQPGERVTVSNVSVTGPGVTGQDRLYVASTGQFIAFSARYSIIDCACPNCIDQIEIGLVPGGKQGCIFNGNPAGNNANTCDDQATTGVASLALTMPETPGAYPIRFRRGNDNMCNSSPQWWDEVEPGPDETVAIVCVR